jgi:hypothetical protein
MPMNSKINLRISVLLLLIHIVSSNANEKNEDIILYESSGHKLTQKPSLT